MPYVEEKDDDKVEFSGRIPRKEFDFFRTTFPQYGATNWFVNAAVKAINDRVRANPDLANSIDIMIDELLQHNRESKDAS